MEYKIIVNPTAGKGKAVKQLPVLRELLKNAGIQYDLELTRQRGHGTELARRAVTQGWPAVVAVGGDGTINEVVNGLAGSDTPLAVIPTGTGNDLARSLKLPRSLVEAVRTLANPRIKPIDMGEDQGVYFTCIAGIGFPADVMYNVNLRKGIFSGPPAIVWGIIKTFKELGEIPLTLEVDGKVMTRNVQGVFILNTVYAGGGLQFSPEANYSDGLLDVLVMRDMSVWEVMSLLPRVYRGTHLSHPKVDFYRASQADVYCEQPVRKMFDGNIVGMTPIKARVFSQALKVIVS